MTTFTFTLDQPAGVLGRVTHDGAVYCAVRNGLHVWALTAESEWTLVRHARTVATFIPEPSELTVPACAA